MRGFEVSQRTQPQIKQGIGKRYPASPMKNISSFPTLILDRSGRMAAITVVIGRLHSKYPISHGVLPENALKRSSRYSDAPIIFKNNL